MGIGEQFAGLDMKNLIGGPLSATADASVLLAQSTADFITKVGFDASQKTRTVLFKFNKQEPDPDGNMSTSEMAVEVPLLAIVPIPNLQIDEVNILFDMEVKQSEKSESSLDMGATMEASARIGPFSISVKGSVASHSSNTRSTDNSAKYHVDVRATNHGTPEGLARVLDMMAANVAPNMLSSKATDSYGKELTGKTKERNAKMKQLREAGMQLSNAESAARDNYDLKLKALKDKGGSMRAAVMNECLKQRNANMESADYAGADKEQKQKAYDEATAKMDRSETYWDNFNSTIAGEIERSFNAKETDPKISALHPKNDELGYPDITSLDGEYADAVKAFASWKKSSQELDANKLEYNTLMMQPAN